MTLVEGTEAALAIIEGWGWDRDDPRFDWSVPLMISLSETINRLAMEGHDDAPGAVLELLATGRLVATGSYRWRCFRKGHFQRDGIAQIPSERWRTLLEGCEKNFDLFVPNEVTLKAINGDWTERKENCAMWSWNADRFSTAEASGGNLFDDGYLEETYSAEDIELRPADCSAASQGATTAALSDAERNRGGAPAKYDWERGIAAVVLQWSDEGSWHPSLQADVKKRLAEWFAERDQFPSDSLLKERARWLFEEFQQRAPEADNLAA